MSPSQQETAVTSASGSSFYRAMCMAPAEEQRDAIIQVYAFCRHVDDIADGTAPAAERYAKLAYERYRLSQCYGSSPPEDLKILHRYIRQFRLPRAEFEKVFDGMLQDVSGEMVFPDQKTFDVYVDNVSCSIGRLLIPILGLDEQRYQVISHHAGIAIQLTNILRDIDDDLEQGFFYLPRELVKKHGILSEDIAVIRHDHAILSVISDLAQQAEFHYLQALHLIGNEKEAGAAVIREMVSGYRQLLTRVCQELHIPLQ